MVYCVNITMDMEDIERKMKLLSQENRRATFTSWVFKDDQVCNAGKMAEAGFFFTGNKTEPDVAECFLCEKSLDGWEAEDDPWTEHVKHSPNCSFATLMSPEDSMTYYQFLDIKAELVKKLYRKIVSREEERLKNRCAEVKKLFKGLK